jgi:TrmH family RNA methyltransferase
MIPLYKLEKLPRIQKLRKITKIFSFAENRLCFAGERKGPGIFTEAELIFFKDASELLSKDSLFRAEAQKIFTNAADVFRQAAVLTYNFSESASGLFPPNMPDRLQAETAAETIRRTLNNIKHILLTETGRDQADWDFTAGSGKFDPVKRQIFEGMLVYLEDIRSPFNVGAMFRTSESFGIEKIFLSPFCANPNHRRAQRTAMGCIDIVPWERRELFSEEGHPFLSCPVFALETGGVPLPEFPFPRCGLLIAGSEELGVSPQALAAADASLGRVSIPCYGAKASLNVSVAFGIALQAWGADIYHDK